MCHTRDYVSERRLYFGFHSKYESPCDEHCEADSDSEDEQCSCCVQAQREAANQPPKTTTVPGVVAYTPRKRSRPSNMCLTRTAARKQRRTTRSMASK